MPGLLRALREADPDYVLLDGTPAECDRVGDGRADYSHKHHAARGERAGGDQPGRTAAVDLARTARPCPRLDRGPHPKDHIRICECQGVPVLAGRAYLGLGLPHLIC